MKKLFCLCLAAILLLSLISCGEEIDVERADKLSRDFINAILSRDAGKINVLAHPEAKDTFENDEFYETLTKNYLIEKGDTLTSLYATGKRYSENETLGGKVIICDFVAFIDELAYDASVTILQNDEYYGVIGFSINFAASEEISGYYNVSEE